MGLKINNFIMTARRTDNLIGLIKDSQAAEEYRWLGYFYVQKFYVQGLLKPRKV